VRNTSEYNTALEKMMGLPIEEFTRRFNSDPIFENIKLEVIRKGDRVNFDFHFDRVQLYLNEDGTIKRAQIG
jgi:hypothetical protein